jgi:hypothetical protein
MLFQKRIKFDIYLFIEWQIVVMYVSYDRR